MRSLIWKIIGPFKAVGAIAITILTIVLAAFIKGKKSGQAAEKSAAWEREIETREENNETIEIARLARDDDKSDILRSDDPQNRANWGS